MSTRDPWVPATPPESELMYHFRPRKNGMGYHVDVTQAPPPPDAVATPDRYVGETAESYVKRMTAHWKGVKLPTDARQRKAIPIVTGVVDYFPDAIAAVAELSRIGNEQHNPGQPLHWDKTKSMDHADCIGRHLIDRGTVDTDGVRHSAKVAWRALALLQIELEAHK